MRGTLNCHGAICRLGDARKWDTKPMVVRVQSHRFWLGAFAASLIVATAGYCFYIARYGVNVVFWDEWSWAPLLHASHLTINSFWVQHNEDRIFFPTILAAALINATNWNDFAFFYVSAAFMLITLLLIVRVFWDDILRSPGWWIPLPFVVLTLAQYQNTLWAFQIAWSVALVAVVGALVLLRHVRPSMLQMGLAIALGFVASYSSLQGLLVWPVGLVLLASRGQTRRAVHLVVGGGDRRHSSLLRGLCLRWCGWNGVAPPDTRQSAPGRKGPPHLARQRDSHSYCWDLGRPSVRDDRGPAVVAGHHGCAGLAAGRPPSRGESVLRGPHRPDTGVRRPVGSHTDRWFDHGGDRLPICHIQLADGGRRFTRMRFSGTRRTAPRTTGSVPSCFARPLGGRSDRGGVVRGRRAEEDRAHGPQHSCRYLGELFGAPLSLAAPYILPTCAVLPPSSPYCLQNGLLSSNS